MGQLMFGNNLALGASSQVLPRARRYIYNAGGDTLSQLFADPELTHTVENPMVADEQGLFAFCYLQAGRYRVALRDARGDVVSVTDDVMVDSRAGGGGGQFARVADLLADTSLSYQPGRARHLVTEGQIIEVAGGGFRYRVEAPLTTLPHLSTAGGIKLSVLRTGDRLNILALGALGDGVSDNTAALQTAVNMASHAGIYSVYVPEGHYMYDTLYLFHDATLNPDYATGRFGRMRLEGEGTLSIADIRSYSPNYGSILESTGGGIVVSSAGQGHGAEPYPARNFSAEGITFVADNTGYVIEAAACPMFHLDRCVIYQKNAAGNGVLLKTAWYADFEHTRLFGVVGTTGTGIVAGSDIFGGVYTLRNSQVDTWRDGVDWQNGVFSNVSLRDSAIQNCTRDGLRGSGGDLLHLLLQNVYFEGESRGTDIRGIGGTIKHLKADQIYTLCGGSDGTNYLSNAVIDLDETSSIELTGVHAQRLTTRFCNVTATSNFGAISGSVRHFSVKNDFTDYTYAGPAFALFTGVLPVFAEGITWPDYHLGYNDAASRIRLYDPADGVPHTIADRRTGTTSIGAVAFGAPVLFAGQTAPVVIHADYRHALIEVDVATAGGVSIRLPNQSYVPGGRLFVVKSPSGSLGDLVVRNNSDNSEIQRLKPGQACVVALDAGIGKYAPWLAPEIAPQADIASLVDASGGAAGGSIAAISGSGADVGVNDNFATLTAKLDAVLASLRAGGLLA